MLSFVLCPRCEHETISCLCFSACVCVCLHDMQPFGDISVWERIIVYARNTVWLFSVVLGECWTLYSTSTWVLFTQRKVCSWIWRQAIALLFTCSDRRLYSNDKEYPFYIDFGSHCWTKHIKNVVCVVMCVWWCTILLITWLWPDCDNTLIFVTCKHVTNLVAL